MLGLHNSIPTLRFLRLCLLTLYLCICILLILCIWPAFCHAIIKRILIDWLIDWLFHFYVYNASLICNLSVVRRSWALVEERNSKTWWKTKLKSREICTVITFHQSVRHLSFLHLSHFSHLTAPINCWPLFSHSWLSYNFYGSAICIKAVYSRDPHCKDFLSHNV